MHFVPRLAWQMAPAAAAATIRRPAAGRSACSLGMGRSCGSAARVTVSALLATVLARSLGQCARDFAGLAAGAQGGPGCRAVAGAGGAGGGVALRALSRPARPEAPVEEDEADGGALATDLVEQVAVIAKAQLEKVTNFIGALKHQMTQKNPKEAEEWTQKGHALEYAPKEQWHPNKKNMEVLDYYDLDEEGLPKKKVMQIPKPENTLEENIKYCFKMATKIQRGVDGIPNLLKQTEQDVVRWRAEAEKAAAWREEFVSSGALTEESSAGVLLMHAALLDEGIVKPPKGPAAQEDPKAVAARAFKSKYGKDIDCFRSPGGFEVIAGRSSKMNEYVSLKLAKGDMPWFHTDNGVPGSHVIIKGSWDQVPEADFEFAAKIAAYHSKSKELRHVPVMYCHGGNVKKQKGTKTGTVYNTGDKFQIMVDPELPAEP
mmetsp:Transcript_102792/g.261146  ORF Transcript_102792/g.261146 Transcript_102792/m.261146 type:complete len:431 (+) Transcript_102792:55-1347(+)